MTVAQIAFFERMKQSHERRTHLNRRVREVLLSARRPMSMEQITQALYDEDSKQVQRRVYALSKCPKSEICSNGQRKGARYVLKS
jgi:hypothetical protein